MKKLLKFFADSKLTLGSVESMTAGLFASEFASIPGASQVFKGGIISYSCSVKENVVGVSKSTIKKHGVVSAEVAEEMAVKGRKLLGVDICVSVTGNAGPTVEPGGKPVGCFYVAVARRDGTVSKCFIKGGKRNKIRNNAVLAMRDMLYLKSI